MGQSRANPSRTSISEQTTNVEWVLIRPPIVRRATRFPGHVGLLVDRDEPSDGERARALLDTALEVYRRIGMPWHIERAEALVAETS